MSIGISAIIFVFVFFFFFLFFKEELEVTTKLTLSVGGRWASKLCQFYSRDDEGGGLSYLRFPSESIFEGDARMGGRIAR